MKRFSILAAMLLLAACDTQVEQPPPEYHGDRSAMVTFTQDPNAACKSIGKTGPSAVILGCEYFGALIVPNPCGQTGAYADLLCHELGHANGWAHD